MAELKMMSLSQKPRLKKWVYAVIAMLITAVLVLTILFFFVGRGWTAGSSPFSYEEVPAYAGEISLEVNGGVPFFQTSSIPCTPHEQYSPLDSLGRCGAATACLDREHMPAEEREGIGMIKPSGWHTVRYDDLIPDKYLYNRCHLIAYMLSGENANEENLITGTRYLNISGMLPYEGMVAEYIMTTGNHVLYRVTPVFVDRELLARGVLMEAYSVEDNGRGVQFNVFIHNVQPGIEIDYLTGDSWRTN